MQTVSANVSAKMFFRLYQSLDVPKLMQNNSHEHEKKLARSSEREPPCNNYLVRRVIPSLKI